MKRLITILCIISFILPKCNTKGKLVHPIFTGLDSKRTGLNFSNDLIYTQAFNLFKYMYFYNGSGIGAADFNNDGKIDLFFGSNQGQNKIFLNQGDLKFKDVTSQAEIPNDSAWTTGISVVDINNDGLPDIYVCRVGQYENLHSKNQLLINQGVDKNGIPHFIDKAKEYGLDFSGFSTQAVFFDYDGDGDLDMFLLNHSVHQNNNFRPRAAFKGTYDPLSGDRIFRNDGNHFTDVTKETGINSTSISYGLGIVVADLNMDGYPDLYIGNDFHENDYLYINQKNGTFKEEGEQRMMHTSQYSMGVDAADVNNDGFPEIISMDMLPSNANILKRSLGEDSWDLFHEKIGMGYSYQFTRNNLQFNRRNGLFSEIGLYSGVAATDWSWAPLWMDFDNDGLKDLFISNGIPKRMNDIDYLNFVTSSEVQQKINNDDMKENDISLIKKFPEIKLPNKFYHNTGNMSFSDEGEHVEGNIPTFSNGAIYADLDNDGDLDIVVSNIDGTVILYENRNNDSTANSFLQLNLKGAPNNINALGAKVILFTGNEIRTYENYPARGFLSSMQIPLHIGLKNTIIDSMFLVWPDRTFERLPVTMKNRLNISYRSGLPLFDFRLLTNHYANNSNKVEDITASTGLEFAHQENRFVEFDREALIPHMVSTEGPAIAVADINKDGLEDVYIGGSREHKSAVFLQQPGGKFIRTLQPAIDADSIYENIDACWVDINNDGAPDLVVASGGNEFYGPDFHNTPRIYVNDGKGNLIKLINPFGKLYLTASSVVANDFNNDGYPDLFIGGRAVPYNYGEIPTSYLLLNNRDGTFSDVTDRYAPGLAHIGFVTSAQWFDINNDGRKDLLLSLEWGGIVAFINNKGILSKKILSDKKGWWNFLLPCDINNNGNIDIIAGNLGLNSRLKASPQEPVRLYFNDFDDNGKKEQVLSYYIDGKELPFATKGELEKQIPLLKKKYLYAADLAKASLTDIFGKDKLANSQVLTADYFSNAILINKGNLNFETRALPWEAQLTSFKTAVTAYKNGSKRPDILLMGNYYENNIEMGRYDADYGTILINQGHGNFTSTPLNGLAIKGQIRCIKSIMIDKRPCFILGRNNDSTMVIRFANN